MRPALAALAAAAAPLTAALLLGGCATQGSSASATGRLLNGARGKPGNGKPLVVVGDKNYTEQFILGELYAQALAAQGYRVQLNPDIGPTEVSTSALEEGQLSMYPEDLGTWNTTVAGLARPFPSGLAALSAGRRYARARGLALLGPTPFSDTGALAVTVSYAAAHRLETIAELRPLAGRLTLGGPLAPGPPPGLAELGRDYGLTFGSTRAMAADALYQALDRGSIQAALVRTTDGPLAHGRYRLLADPRHAFGWGEIVAVVSTRALRAEGPPFARTIERVSALLTLPVMRQLNAAVDTDGQDPAAVAHRFLLLHRLAGT